MTSHKFTADLMILSEKPMFFTKNETPIFISPNFPMDTFCVYENVEYCGTTYKSAILCHPSFNLNHRVLNKY